VRQSQASVNTAQAACNTAQLSYENAKKLFENKVIGDFELQSAANSYESAKASLSLAQAGLASAKEMLSFCYVKSPAAGVVGTLPFKKGALVNTASVLTTVSNNSSMEVYFSLTEKDALAMSQVEGGQKAAMGAMPNVQLQLADGTIYAHEGKVTKMSGVIDPATGSIQVIALFPNPEKILKSGGSGSIIIPKSNSDAIVISQACVSEVQNKKFVYVLGKDNKVKYTEIQVDPQNDGNSYIVTDGLKVGDKYVTNGITKLNDGMEIVPITPEKYQQKIDEQAKAMTAGDIVGAMKK
jgi:membrane fusion protein (multidrug efflux system)